MKSKVLKRGMVIATPNTLKLTNRIIAYLKISRRTDWVIKNKQRLMFHIGTAKLLGRVSLINNNKLLKGQCHNVIINFESPIVVVMDDRFVVRSYSPVETIAGGVVLDPFPIGKWSDIKNLAINLSLDPKTRFEYLLLHDWKFPKTIKEWMLLFFISEKRLLMWTKELCINASKDGILFSNRGLEKGKDQLILFFKNSYNKNPFRLVLSAEGFAKQFKWSEQWVKIVIDKMVQGKILKEQRGGFSLYEFEPSFSTNDLDELKAIELTIQKSGSQPILVKEITSKLSIKSKRVGDLLHLLFDQGKVIKLGNNFWLNKPNFDKVISDISQLFKIKNQMDVSEFKDLTGLSRKTAIPLLEYLDKKQYTVRNKNIRMIGKTLHG